MSLRGFVVALVLDLSDSRRYDLRDIRLLEWIIHMIQQKLFKSNLLQPPCTTFSSAAHPACRSYQVPEGWVRQLPKVFIGNLLAFRCLIIMFVSVRCETPAGLEQPRLSKMAWLSDWRWLLSLGCAESIVASCFFGSIHRKKFRLLTYLLVAEEMTRRCPGGHEHVPIQGAHTKPSAVYEDGVADHFADFFF